MFNPNFVGAFIMMITKRLFVNVMVNMVYKNVERKRFYLKAISCHFL